MSTPAPAGIAEQDRRARLERLAARYALRVLTRSRYAAVPGARAGREPRGMSMEVVQVVGFDPTTSAASSAA